MKIYFFLIELIGEVNNMYDVIIVGAGPAGLFAAYELITKNKKLKVLLLDQGKLAEDRVCPMNKFGTKCKNCKPCNILSGFGGAGTFSDGKLNTLTKDSFNRQKKVFEIFVENGAPEEIMYLNKPHIGTDILRKVIINIRNKIISMGGEFRYNSCP